MLILFDIDGTLLASDGAGRAAMESAGSEVFGVPFSCEGISFLGSLDGNIYAELCQRHAIADGEQQRAHFRAVFAQHLARRLSEPGAIWLLPGVAALVDAAERVDGLTLGILSGNFPETGRLKVAASGLAPERFPVSAWGDDGEHRRDLPPVALSRYASHVGSRVRPQRVLIIGDTPRDVDCARANGCRSLAVATGFSTAAELHASGADRVVADLRETTDVLAWILDGFDGPARPG